MSRLIIVCISLVMEDRRLCSIWFIDSSENYEASKLEVDNIDQLVDLDRHGLEYQLSAIESLVCHELGRSDLCETWSKFCFIDDIGTALPHTKQQEILALSLEILNSVSNCVSVSFRLRESPEKKYWWRLCVITEGNVCTQRLKQLFSSTPELCLHEHVINRPFKASK